MKTVNYYILSEIFSLLERVQLMDHIAFEEFDPDDEQDVVLITEKFIKPSFEATSKEKQEMILRSIDFFTQTKKAPLQLFRDRCQELCLPDAECWNKFFRIVRSVLDSDSEINSADNLELEEKNDEEVGQMIFANV